MKPITWRQACFVAAVVSVATVVWHTTSLLFFLAALTTEADGHSYVITSAGGITHAWSCPCFHTNVVYTIRHLQPHNRSTVPME